MNNNITTSFVDENELVQSQRDFMTKVYGWMVGGMLLTALVAWYVVDNEVYRSFSSGMFMFLVFAEFGLVIAISSAINKMSTMVAAGCFLVYSALNGLTLSVILVYYTAESVASTFVVTAGMFGAMSLYGAVTKKNLNGVGSFMFMGLIGIILVMFINFFLQSSALMFAINVLGVLIFAGLTAYDTQKLKDIHAELGGSQELQAKVAIVGALTLYLDFINMFLFLLRLFGSRR